MAYKEIVTKAVIGKGKKNYKETYQIEVDTNPSTILGCWIINHDFRAHEEGDKIVIDGSYDVNIWYAYDNDTKTNVVNKKITYNEMEKMDIKESEVINKEIIVRSLKQPTCISAHEEGNIINIEIEKELGIEIVGDTMVKIAPILEDDDNWLDLDNKIDEMKIDDNSINPNYINEEKTK